MAETAADLPSGPSAVHRRSDAEALAFPDGSTIELMTEADPTTSSLGFHRTTLRSGAVGAGPHRHRTGTEHFFVLDGKLRFLIDDDVIDVTAGALVSVAAGTVHAFAASGAGADVLVITPHVNRAPLFRHYAEVAGGSTAAQPLGTAEIEARFDTYAVRASAWNPSLPTT